MMRLGGFAAALLVCVRLLVTPAQAIEPETVETVVLRNKVSDGYGFAENFVPSQIGTFYLLSDEDNALSYVQTLEYYWPLSRQIYVAFDRLNVPLKGTLRIAQGGKTIAEVAPDRYAVVYPEGSAAGGAAMVWGDKAERALEHYLAMMGDYNRRLADYQADRIRYERDLKNGAEARLKGLPVPEVSPPLPMPDPVRHYVTGVSTAYRVHLPAGRYSVALYDEDRLVVGSERELRVIAPQANAAVTYDIVPEERWTRLLASNTKDDSIYSARGKTFYVVLNHADRFDDSDYARLINPQRSGQEGRENWVRRRPAVDKSLEAQFGDGRWERLELTAYKVRQTRGASLGYVIEPSPPSENPDLLAYAVTIPNDPLSGKLRLRVVDRSTGAAEPGSEREVVIVAPADAARIWGAAGLPLVFGFLVLGVRAWRNRSGKAA